MSRNLFPTARRRPVALAVASMLVAMTLGAPGSTSATVWSLSNPNLTWANPLAWAPVGEPSGGGSILIGTSLGIAYAPLLHPNATFESVSIGQAFPIGGDPPANGFSATSSVFDAAGFYADRGAGSFSPVLEVGPSHTLRAGTLSVGNGYRTEGALLLRGGVAEVTGSVVAGGWSGTHSVGYIRLIADGDTSPALTIRDNLVLMDGFAGQSFFQQEAGRTSVGASLIMANHGGYTAGYAFMNLAGGILAVGVDSVIGNEGAEGPGREGHAGVRQGAARHEVGRDLVLGLGANSVGSYETMPGAVVLVGRDLVIGGMGRASFVHGGGTLDVARDLVIGRRFLPVDFFPANSDWIEVRNDATLRVGGRLVVGSDGDWGELRHAGSSTLQLVGGAVLGRDALTRGTLTLSGSGGIELGADMVVGQNGVGQVVQRNGSGAVRVAGNLSLGAADNGLGSWLSTVDSRLDVLGGLVIGQSGDASMSVASLVVGGDIVLGQSAGGGGQFTAIGSGFTNPSLESGADIVIGQAGIGFIQVDHSSFQARAVRDMVLGRSAGSRGTAILDGGSFSAGRDVVVGQAGIASMTFSNGARLSAGRNLLIGEEPGAEGVLRLLPGTGALAVDGVAWIGRRGQGLLELDTGQHRIDGGIAMAQESGSRATLLLLGTGSLHLNGHLALNGAGDARVVQDGLDLRIDGVLGSDLIMGASAGSRNYELRSGMLEVSNSLQVGNGSFAATGGTLLAKAIHIGDAGHVTLDRSLTLGGPPGTGHGVAGEIHLGTAASALTVPTLFVHAGSLLLVAEDAQLQTDVIMMDGGSIHGVLLNTGQFHYSGGSFEYGAGLRNDGSVDLQADLMIGSLANAGSFEVQALRSVEVRIVERNYPTPPTTGVATNTGQLRVTGGNFTARGLSMAAGASFDQIAGNTSLGASGLLAGSAGSGLASLDIGGGVFAVAGPTDIGGVGAATLRVQPNAALRVDGHALVIGAAGQTDVQGQVDAYGLHLAGRYRQTAGRSMFGAGGVTVGAAGPGAAELSVLGGQFIVDGPMTIGSAGPASVEVRDLARLFVGNSPADRLVIGSQGRLSLENAMLSKTGAATALDLRVDAGGVLQMNKVGLDGIGTIDLQGRLEWTGPDHLNGSGRLVIGTPGTFVVESSGEFGLPVDNFGLILQSGTGTIFRNALQHQGDLQLAPGSWLTLYGGGVGGGRITAADDATLTLGGSSYRFDGVLDNRGRVSINGQAVASFGGAGQHSGVVYVDGPFGALARLVLDGASWRFAGTGSVLGGSGEVRLLSGSVDFDAGSTLGPPEQRYGEWTALTLNLWGGTLRMNAGSQINMNGNIALAGTDLMLSTGTEIRYANHLTLSAGALGGSDRLVQTSGSFNWSGGTLYGPGELDLGPSTVLRMTGAAGKRLDRPLISRGLAFWDSGEISGVGSLQVLNNTVGNAAASFAPNLLVNSTYKSNAANAGVASFLGRVDVQGGFVDVIGGTMRLAGGGSSDSPLAVRPGSFLEFAGGEFLVDGSNGADARINGEGTVVFSGGRTLLRNGADYGVRFGPLGGERFTGGVLELASGSRYQFNPTLTIEAGALIVGTGSGPFTLPATTTLAGGQLAGSDPRQLAAGGLLDWRGGTLGGPGSTTVAPGATLRMGGAAAKSLESDLGNAGLARWDDGNVAGLATFSNVSGAQFDIMASASFGPALDNAGLLRVANGDGTAVLTRTLRNDGRLRVESGALQISGSLLNLSGGTLSGGEWFVAGTLRHAGAAVSTVGADIVFSGAGASFNAMAGNTELLDSFSTITGIGRLRVEAGRDVTQANRTIEVAGLLQIGAGSAFHASSGALHGAGLVEVLDGGQMNWTRTNLSATGTLRVAAGGRLVMSDAGSNHTHAGRTLINQGTVQWSAGDVSGGNTGALASSITNAGLWLDDHGAVNSSINHGNALPATTGVFTNSGTYRKTGTGTTTFVNQILDNNGRLELAEGALVVNGSGFNRAGGVIDIAAGRTLTMFGSDFRFEDGSSVTGAGVLQLQAGSSVLPAATIDGRASFSNLLLAGGQVAGTHTLDGRIRWALGALGSGGTTTIAPTATLVLENGNSNHTHAGRTLINQGTVQWSAGDVSGGSTGALASSITNAGLWLDDHGAVNSSINHGNALPATTGVFTNTGTYRKTGTGTTTVFAHQFDNSGRVDVQAGRLDLQVAPTQVVGTRLAGGAWEVGPGATLAFTGVAALSVNEGDVHLRGAGATFGPINALAENRGVFRISEGRNFTTAGNLVNSGLLFAGAGSRLTVNGTLTSAVGGVLAGSGELQVGLLSAAGAIAPGSSPGRLLLTGNLAMQESAALEIEIAGLEAGVGYDMLEVTGAAQLGGELHVNLLGSFDGIQGNTFTILSAGSVSGQFNGLSDGARFSAAGVGGSFAIDYTPTAVHLTAYVAAAPVPEPGTWAMMGAGLALMALRVRRPSFRPSDPRMQAPS